MPPPTRAILVVSMDVDPAHEALFNDVYDKEHIPNLLKVPGVLGVTRWKGAPFQFAIGGEMRQVAAPSPTYTAIYELENKNVPSSPEWAEAVEKGRWPTQVRPHTSNRTHALYELHQPA